MKKRKIFKIIGISLFILFGVIFTFAKIKRISPLAWNHKTVNQPVFSDKAINGYDPVAYMVSDEAIEGNEQYTYRWQDADWFFATEENRDLFAKNPQKYAPQYGGFCAFAVSKGFTANVSPESFVNVEGKIYLFADDNVKAEWLNTKEESFALSEKNWN